MTCGQAPQWWNPMTGASRKENYPGSGKGWEWKFQTRQQWWMNVRFHSAPVIHTPWHQSLPVYHINWLRTRSHWNWWKKELSITSHEMVWLVLWFQNRADIWRHRAHSEDASTGITSCAYRQVSMWDKLKRQAVVHFYQVHKDFSCVFGYDSIASL